jgi:hypothetical protein
LLDDDEVVGAASHGDRPLNDADDVVGRTGVVARTVLLPGADVRAEVLQAGPRRLAVRAVEAAGVVRRQRVRTGGDAGRLTSRGDGKTRQDGGRQVAVQKSELTPGLWNSGR